MRSGALVARQAHNLEVVSNGSIPTSATKIWDSTQSILLSRCICLLGYWVVLDFETADNQNLLGSSSPLFPTKMRIE